MHDQMQTTALNPVLIDRDEKPSASSCRRATTPCWRPASTQARLLRLSSCASDIDHT
jgi:hypothetical protein